MSNWQNITVIRCLVIHMEFFCLAFIVDIKCVLKEEINGMSLCAGIT